MTLFAILPAAGKSSRMQAGHKLLLPWPGDEALSVLDMTLRNWLSCSAVSRVVLVLKSDSKGLISIARQYEVEVVLADPAPDDMKASVRLGLVRLREMLATLPCDSSTDESANVMIAPADFPTIPQRIISEIDRKATATGKITAPRFVDEVNSKPGHPICFPWPHCERIEQLPADAGIDRILQSADVQWSEFPFKDKPKDLDTDEDYLRLRNGLGSRH